MLDSDVFRRHVCRTYGVYFQFLSYGKYYSNIISAHLPPTVIPAREAATSPGEVMELSTTVTPPAKAMSSTKVLSRELETRGTPMDL